MLWLWLLTNGIGVVLPSVQTSVLKLTSSKMWADILFQLVYAAAYLTIFTIPVIVLRRLIGKSKYPYYSTRTDLRLSPHLPSIVLGGIFLILVQSYINEALVSIFDYSSFSKQVLWEKEDLRGYGVVLRFITAALVPAFCEELLFRGAILTNLLPFGRSNAILISALLFAMMHQNAEQILYAFAAGILLGALYERTGSIWNCVFLHLMNNFSSIAMSVLSKKLHRDAGLGGAAAELLLCLLCVGGVVLLVKVLSPVKDQFKDGIFGKSFPAADTHTPCRIAPNRCVSLFFSFPMVLFFVLSLWQIITLIWRAVVFHYA